MSELRWYGWGDAAKTYSFDRRPRAWEYLCSALGLRGDESFPVCDFSSIRLRTPRLTDTQSRGLRDRSSPGAVKSDTPTRILHSYGKSYRDLVRLRRGDIPNPPDAVVFPSTEEQASDVISFCAQNDIVVIPFGGGSNVVGGVEPRDERVTIALDMARLNRILSVDESSKTAVVQAGILGPDLERALNERGLTLGHFPSTFEFSTLGGWIATRGAGSFATGYGKIEGMAQSVRIATPRGIAETPPVPASATGPSLLQLFVGSEGALGAITRATMRVRPLPKRRDYRGLLFKSIPEGIGAIQTMLQSGLVPAFARLYDEAQTRGWDVFRDESSPSPALLERVRLRWMAARGYSFDRGALLLVGFEDDTRAGEGLSICRSHGAFDLGEGPAIAWLRERFDPPYMLDVLVDRGVLVDTVETATNWENLNRLREAVGQALVMTSPSPLLVHSHISHAYRDGASLTVTFMTRMDRGNQVGQWEMIRRGAIDAIIASGGALSHHHGIGYEHMPWVTRVHGAVGMEALRALKSALDPNNVMNPGKWLTTSQTSMDMALEYQERFWNRTDVARDG